MIRVISIHGTFANNADWVQRGSSFQNAILEQLGNGVVFEEPLLWTGRNSIEHRQKASEEFSKRLLNSKSSNPNDTYVAIGHSHGGSVIAYALINNPAVSQSLSGVAFLATPFIDIRPQQAWEHTIRTLSSVCAAVLWILVTLALAATVLSHTPTNFEGYEDYVALLCALASMMLGVGLFRLVPPFSERMIALVRLRLEKVVRSVSSSILPDGPCYAYIRSPGDEAAGVLSVLQMLAWPFMRLQAKLSSIFFASAEAVVRLWQAGRGGRGLILGTVLSVATGSIAIMMSYVVSQLFGTGFELTNTPFEEWIELDLEGVPVWLLDVLNLAVRFGMALTLVSGTVIGAAFAVFVSVVVLVSISSMAFGASLWSVGPFVELVVEPLPRGKWQLNRLGWDQEDANGLNHSSPYSSRNGVRALTDWLQEIRRT